MFSTGKQDENADYEHVAVCLSHESVHQHTQI